MCDAGEETYRYGLAIKAPRASREPVANSSRHRLELICIFTRDDDPSARYRFPFAARARPRRFSLLLGIQKIHAASANEREYRQMKFQPVTALFRNTRICLLERARKGYSSMCAQTLERDTAACVRAQVIRALRIFPRPDLFCART